MPVPFRLNTRALAVICLAALGWAFSFGLSAPLASLWLQDAGWNDSIVGYNTATYYLGIALTAGFIPRLMRRWGAGCVVAGCFLSGVTAAAFPWCHSLAAFFVVRLANGIAGAMSLIPLETFVNRDSPPERRSRNFGFYAFAIALGWALGNFVGIEMYRDAPYLAFTLGGLAAVLAGNLLLAGFARPAGSEIEAQGKGPVELRRNILSFGTAWCQGFLEGGMVAFLALYLLRLGIDDDGVSWITSGVMIGVIVFQVPVAWLADRCGRMRVLVGCYGVVLAGLALLPFCGVSPWLVLWLFLVGACSGAFYPLGLTTLGERVPGPGLARANAWYLALNCLGSLMGPGIMGEVMERCGQQALFTVGLVAVGLVPAVWVGLRLLEASQRGRSALAVASPVGISDREAA
jgi:MFS family permease